MTRSDLTWRDRVRRSRPRQLARSAVLRALGPMTEVGLGIHVINGHHMGPLSSAPPEVFDRQLEALSGSVDFVRIEDAMEMISRNFRPSRPALAFTFDDGFSEWVTHVAPVLESRGVNAAFFINPGFVDLSVGAWDEFNETLGGLRGKRPLVTDDVVRLANSGHVIGAHTVTHPSLNTDDMGLIAREVVDCQRLVTQLTGKYCDWFAWPFGGFDDISPQALEAALDTYALVFSAAGYPAYHSFGGRVQNRRHVEPFWRVGDAKFFLRKVRPENS